MRKTMIAFAAALAVCTATMMLGTTASFARGGGSFGGGTRDFGGGGFGGHGFAVGRSDGGHFSGGFGHLGRGDRLFGRFGFGLYGYAGGFYSDYGYGACSVPLLWAMPALATNNERRKLPIAPDQVRRLGQPWAGNKTADLRCPRRGFGSLQRCDAAHCLPSAALVQS
jgi:hypothetical protein